MTSIVTLTLTLSLFTPGQEVPNAGKPPAASKSPAPAAKEAKSSAAEHVARLQRLIDFDQQQLEKLKAQLDDPGSEFRKAEAEFGQIDKLMSEKQKRLAKQKKDGDAEKVKAIEAEIRALEKPWKLAKDRFDLAIQERKTIQQRDAVLREAIQNNKAALDKVLGVGKPANEKSAVAEASRTATPSKTPAVMPTVPTAPVPTTTPDSTKAGDQAVKNGAASLALVKGDKVNNSKEIVKARQEFEKKEADAAEAKDKSRSITERLESLQKSVELEKKVLETARKKSDLAHETVNTLGDELQKLIAANAPQEELKTVSKKIDEAQDRFNEARTNARAIGSRLHDLQSELSQLQAEHIQAAKEEEQLLIEVERAKERLANLQNPFTPVNMLQWLLDHGPKLLLILVAMVALHRVVRMSSQRLVKFMAARVNRGDNEEGEKRAETLVSVFRNLATMSIYGGGMLMLLDEVGIPIIPLLGGAAVFGLAVAFGAQNLIRDYFSGFMVLLEDQYGIHDVIKIGEVTGQVEKITLRMTALRDQEGTVHFIPHGNITQVSNMTHGWSRAVFSIGVAYTEDPDKVMKILIDLAKAMRRESQWASLILEDPEMLGVDRFDDSAVIITFYMKTRPLKQWPIRRELLRRIKYEFDRQGIEIPYPHQVVVHRDETESGLTASKDVKKKSAA